MPVCRVTPKAAIQAHRVLMTRSPGLHTLWPTFDSAMNMVTFFNRRGVTPVRCDTDSSSSLPVLDRSSTSRNRRLARSSPQCAGMEPSQSRPESL